MHHLLSTAHLCYEARRNKFATIGHTIVERKRGNGRNLCFISDAHPRECGSIPTIGVVSTIANARLFVAWNGDMKIFHDTDALQSRHKLVGIAGIGIVDEGAHSDIR